VRRDLASKDAEQERIDALPPTGSPSERFAVKCPITLCAVWEPYGYRFYRKLIRPTIFLVICFADRAILGHETQQKTWH
jgi:hypothetical protein